MKETTNKNGKYSGIIPLLRNNLNDGGGALLLAVVGEAPWSWVPKGAEGWGCREETDLPEWTITVSYGPWKQLHHLDAVGLCESGLGFHVWDHVMWFWISVCVYVCVSVCVLRDVTLLAQVKCELSKHFSPPLHTGYTLCYSFLSSAIPQVWLIFIFLRWRWYWTKWPKFLTS